MLLLLLYLSLAIGVSFLCSLLESALLSVPRSHLAVLAEEGGRAGRTGVRLERMKSDVDRPLAAILTLNTFAHTLGAAGTGAQAAILWGEAWVGAVGVVVTLLILIVSEIIPKTLGAVHAKRLAPFTAWTVQALIIALLPVVKLSNWFSKLLSRGSQATGQISREEVGAMARVAHEEGALDQSESQVIGNLIALRRITVEDVMTPRTVVFTLGAAQTVGEVTAGPPPRFARIPVVGRGGDIRSAADVVGMVSRHELQEAAGAGRLEVTIADLARPLHIVPESAKLPAVLAEFLRRREQLFLVVDEYGGVAGIITLEDVIETLLGVEIVDEADPAEDMRGLARRLASRRRG